MDWRVTPNALIFYEPTRKETVVYALPVADTDHQHISSHFGEAPCFRLITVRLKDKTVINEGIIKNPFGTVDHGKGILVAELLIKHSIDAVLTRESFEGRGPFYVFSNAAVDMLLTREKTVALAMADLGISV